MEEKGGGQTRSLIKFSTRIGAGMLSCAIIGNSPTDYVWTSPLGHTN